jgi:hypothetical protein
MGGRRENVRPNNGAGIKTEQDNALNSAIDDAARMGVMRTEAQDPLSKDKQGIMPMLLIGRQVSYDPDVWRPNYSLLPEDDPERIAFERGEPIPFTESQRYKGTLRFLDELDADSGFNRAD